MFEALFLVGTVTMTTNGIHPLGLNLGVSELSFFLALLALIFERIRYRVPVLYWFPYHPFWITALLVLLGGMFASMVAGSPAASVFNTLKTVFVFSFWIAMGVVMIVERKKEIPVLIAICAVPLLSSTVAVWDAATHFYLGPRIAQLIGNGTPDLNLATLARVYGRYTGILGHPNIQSELTVSVIPIFLVGALFAWRSKQTQRAVAFTIATLLLVLANYLTGSVTGLVCLGLTLIAVLFLGWLREYPKLFLPGMFALCIMLVGTLLFVAVFWNELGFILKSLENNMNLNRALTNTGPGRFTLVGDALNLISKYPLTGYGMDRLNTEFDASVDLSAINLHTGVLRAWLFGGIFAFIGVLYAYLRALGLSLSGIMKYLHGSRDWLILGLSISVIMWTINDLTVPSFYQRFTWITAVMLYGLLVRPYLENKTAQNISKPSQEIIVDAV